WRKKTPLYVAATVDYYRKVLDSGLTPDEDDRLQARLQTIFARPWTTLFHHGPHNPDAADTLVVGHRGARVGTVAASVRTPAGPGIRFRTALAIERHDGIQIDIPGEARPYGFPVDALFTVDARGKLAPAFTVPAGSEAAVTVPYDAPDLVPGLPVYQSSSQEVKRSYPFTRPKAGAFLDCVGLAVDVAVAAVPDAGQARITVIATTPAPLTAAADSDTSANGQDILSETVTLDVLASPARDPDGAARVAETAFSRLGGSGFYPDGWSFRNPDRLAIRPGDWNQARRTVTAALTEKRAAAFQTRVEAITTAVLAKRTAEPVPARADEPFRWSLAVDDLADVEGFTDNDRMAATDISVTVTDDPDFPARLDAVAEAFGREKVRLSLPLILRNAAADRLRPLAGHLIGQGYRRWLVPGLGGWELLLAAADGEDLDLRADWTLPCVNHCAADQLFAMGFASATLSPEDEPANWQALLARYPSRLEALVYADLPLFVSAACAHQLIGRCGATCSDTAPAATGGRKEEKECPGSGSGGCRQGEMTVRMEKSGPVVVRPYQGGSVVSMEQPYSLAGKLVLLNELGLRAGRVDLRWKRRTATEAVELWRRTRAGRVEGLHGNFTRSWR
ncbi:MAG: U32 family peptidase, partial [Planctomycetes bacterium]|nr:U32 family peptidase [Planctomycetota bacterium]